MPRQKDHVFFCGNFCRETTPTEGLDFPGLRLTTLFAAVRRLKEAERKIFTPFWRWERERLVTERGGYLVGTIFFATRKLGESLAGMQPQVFCIPFFPAKNGTYQNSRMNMWTFVASSTASPWSFSNTFFLPTPTQDQNT